MCSSGASDLSRHPSRNLVTVAGNEEANNYLKRLSKNVAPLAKAAHVAFLKEGCTSYVKTIYIGYDVEGEMVGALYGHGDHIEVALALPEDAEGSILIDASHLTWRTLPVAAVARSTEDVGQLNKLIAEACQRVRTQQHDVLRDPEFFMKAKRDRSI
jgi:hypothetical protein